MSAVQDRQPDAAAVSSGPGRRLAEARAAQSLSAADVARHLKLSVWQVEALESGNYQQLPGPIFVRGFIRNYARLVKLDPQQLVQSLGDSVPAAATRPEPSPSRDIPFPARGRPRWTLVVMPVALIVLLLAVYEFYWNDPEGVPAALPPAAPAPQAQKKSPEPVPGAVPAQTAAAPGNAPKPAASVATPRGTQPTEEPSAVAAASADAVAEQPLKRGERQLKLAFDQECWVEIRDRNERVIFSQLNRPGTQQSVTGIPPFSVIVGNAHGVRMTYDDKPVDLAPHTKIDVARLILP